MERRSVVVTGASSGIGRAIALRLASRGLRTFAGVRRSEDGAALVAAAGPAAAALAPLLLDVTDSASLETAADTVRRETGGGLFGLVFVVVGLSFKIGAVPFHMWIPDVYDGAPTAVTLYVSTAPKVAALALFFRLLVTGLHTLSPSWQTMLAIVAFLSMGVGSVIAIAQTSLKRMLAYSAIAHMGFALLGLVAAGRAGYADALFYLLVYAVMSLGAFGLAVLLSRRDVEVEDIDDLSGLNQKSPWTAFLMLLLMFAMAGVPPTAGFYAKLVVIQAVVDAGFSWLAVAAVLFSVIGAYYYLRVIKVMYFDPPRDDRPLSLPLDGRLLLGLNGLSMLVLTPWLGTLIAVCRTAVRGLP